MIDEFLETLQIPSGTSRRFDCPVCTGRLTFSVANKQGAYVYNCFRNSCAVSGSKTVGKTLSEVKNILQKKQAVTDRQRAFIQPDYWLQGLASESMQDYVKDRHIGHAYKNNLVELMYDPRQDRCVFIQRDGDIIVNAVGRALNKYTLPKVYIYTRHSVSPFVVGSGTKLVLVEDLASACAVTRLEGYVGLALLGTNLLPHHVGILKDYNNIIVALDKDATRTALDLKREASFHNPNTGMWMLRKDIKDMTLEELEVYVK